MKAINDIKKTRENNVEQTESLKEEEDTPAIMVEEGTPKVKEDVKVKIPRTISKKTNMRKVGLVKTAGEKSRMIEDKRLRETNKSQEKELGKMNKKYRLFEGQFEKLKRSHSACSVDLLMKRDELAAKELKVQELQTSLKQAEKKRVSERADKGLEVNRMKKENLEKEKLLKEKENIARKALMKVESLGKEKIELERETVRKLKERDATIQLMQTESAESKVTIELLKKQLCDLATKTEEGEGGSFEERMLIHQRRKKVLVEECKERTFQRMREKAAKRQEEDILGASEDAVPMGIKRKALVAEEEIEEPKSKRRRFEEFSLSLPLASMVDHSALSMGFPQYVSAHQVKSGHIHPSLELICHEQASMVAHQVYDRTLLY